MNQTLIMWIGIIFISGFGTLSHFLYELTHHNKIIGLFAAVNESIWEHVKITLTATFIWSLVDGALFGADPNYIIAKFVCLMIIILFIPLAYYAYHHFTHQSMLPLDITIFLLSIILSQFAFYGVLNSPVQGFAVNYFATIFTFVIFGCYMTLTIVPRHVGLFKDPLNGKYGLSAHQDFIHHHHTHKTKKQK